MTNTMSLCLRTPAVLFLALAAPALAQSSPARAGLEAELARWQAVHGDAWRVRADGTNGFARFVYGGSVEGSFTARSDAQYFAAARGFLGEMRGLFGVEESSLIDDAVVFLPLALAGSTDKIAVRFEQSIGGVKVIGGSVNALLTPNGDLLALDSQALPSLASFDVAPRVAAEDALEFAVLSFRADTGLPESSVSEPSLAIDQELVDGARAPALVWEVDVQYVGAGEPEGFVYRVAADGALRTVSRARSIHFFDVGGTVFTKATPGVKPDTSSNPEVQFPARYMTITAGALSTTSDANGLFNFPGVSGPLSVTFSYNGTYNDVVNNSGSDLSLTQSLSGTSNSVVLNNTPTEQATAQANAFHQINVMRDWTRSVNPADATSDFVALANVNIASTCNAFFNGSSTNYFLMGGGCVNTAYSTVIHHEMGHWLNVDYGSGNGFDGFGEGNADDFAMYVNDNPIVGEDFTTSGGDIRTGLNTRQYCGDNMGGCYGEVHADGEVLMGVLWKVRANLNVTYGDATGDVIADLLFNAWMNAYDQGTIDSIIEEQWLTLDDDNGNVNDGSPNYGDIEAAFLTQGFPGFDLPFLYFTGSIEPTDTQDDVGPYGIAVDISTNFGASVANAAAFYRVGSGAFASIPLTDAGNGTWAGLIPGIPSPSVVAFYVQADDGQGHVITLPEGAPALVSTFHVGLQETLYFEDFEGAGDEGWTHQSYYGVDDWQHDVPEGNGGVVWDDPASAVSGTKIWGTDVRKDGFYFSDSSSYLRSPSIDTSAAEAATLRFQRWLTVEDAAKDQATIVVNGTTVFTNPTGSNLIDLGWQLVEYDLSVLVDGVPSTSIDWTLTAGLAGSFGGWSIDDVELVSFLQTPTQDRPTNYGTGLAGTTGVPAIDSAGELSLIGNADFRAVVKNALVGATAYVGLGFASASAPIFGGTLLIVPQSVTAVTVDIFGQASVALPIADDAGLVGLAFYLQAFVADAGAPGPFAMTPGLQAVIGQ